jgi:hypothetical protein
MMLDTNALSAWADGDVALLRVLSKDRLWHLPVVVLGTPRSSTGRAGAGPSEDQPARESGAKGATAVVEA